jgi:hypothetical protein
MTTIITIDIFQYIYECNEMNEMNAMNEMN